MIGYSITDIIIIDTHIGGFIFFLLDEWNVQEECEEKSKVWKARLRLPVFIFLTLSFISRFQRLIQTIEINLFKLFSNFFFTLALLVKLMLKICYE